MAAKLASPMPMIRRCGSQSAAWIRTCLPQSVSFLCWRLPDWCWCQYRFKGAMTVRTGVPNTARPKDGQQHEREPAQAARLNEVTVRRTDRVSIDAMSLIRPPHRRSIVSSRPITTGSPLGTKVSTSQRNRWRDSQRLDYMLRLSTRC
jgi:hypothetical protein